MGPGSHERLGHRHGSVAAGCITYADDHALILLLHLHCPSLPSFPRPGKEFFDKGANVQLGPGVCLARVPVNGRNFEYLSGEDPFIGYTMIQPVVKGIQSQNVIANAKHYINNNQETNRGTVSENLDERTEFEMYMPPFEGAIDAGVGSYMCSYNKINGTWSCENPQTLATDLKVNRKGGPVFFFLRLTLSLSRLDPRVPRPPSLDHV